ncbi:MAG: dihydrodipicolinate synthase family protein [Deltaproteobacteria bacterium]|nr:dihydrodipicolinate synthase family protein [Deltaproteobacteria bacterium]MDZ4345845.1 dihydrodipicolinate synthase family protein [Candidatus Binatia bacterium]
MLTAGEMNGVLGMMPGFAAPDAVDIRATQTIAVDNLKEGVDKIIKDGVNDIATTGTYGECYNLLFDEFKTLAMTTVEAVKKRVPLFIGCTSPNPREVVQKMNFVKGLGADGVLLRNHLAGRRLLGHGLPTILDGRSGQKKIRPTD